MQWLLLNDNNLDKFNGNNTLLVENLFLNNNVIDKLVLSSNSTLKQLHANNIDLTTLSATGNLLTCISVDNPDDILMPYSSWSIDLGVILSANCGAEPKVILIPDPYFEAALGRSIDSNGINGNILVSDALNIISLDIHRKNISDLTGIESFENLEVLKVHDNLLTGIDLSNNTNLTELNVAKNQLQELFINSGRKLLILNASINRIDTIDLSDLTDIIELKLNQNFLLN